MGPPVPRVPPKPGQEGPQGPGPDDGAMVLRRIHRREDRLASKRMRPPLVGAEARALNCPTVEGVEYISARARRTMRASQATGSRGCGGSCTSQGSGAGITISEVGRE